MRRKLLITMIMAGTLVLLASSGAWAAGNAGLKSLQVTVSGSREVAALNTPFTSTESNYYTRVADTTQQIAVAVNPSDSNAVTWVYQDGQEQAVCFGADICQLNLASSTTIIHLVVVAGDGLTSETYQLKVFRGGQASGTPGSLVRQTVLKLSVGDTTAYVNDVPTTLEAKPFFYRYHDVNYTMVPLRFIGEQGLGATINWHSLTKRVAIINGGEVLEMALGEIAPAIGLTCPPVVVKNRLFVPLRYVAESLGCEVEYQAVTEPIMITASTQI